MNNSRRKRINQSILALTNAQKQMKKALDEERATLARIPDDEDYEEMRDAIDEIISNLDDAVTNLGEALDTLDNADF